MVMIALGIESTAHTLGVGIVNKKGKILANVRELFTTVEGGMVPSDVGEHHTQVIDKVIKEALDEAGVSLSDISLISFSQSPGLGHCLRVGAFTARVLAKKLNIPIVGVNHCIAHLEIGNLQTGAKDPVMLYASGANTQIIAYEGGKYRIFGETLDMGVGNFLDSFARELGLGFPGGPKVYELALQGKEFIDIPYYVKGMDMNFGGILTNIKQKYAKGYSKDDLCYSVQETVFAMLIEVSERALAHTGKKELLFGGGVGCNKRLQEMAKIMCEERGAKLYVPDNSVMVDNGAMIAWQGILEYKSNGGINVKDAVIKPYLRTDDIDVSWR